MVIIWGQRLYGRVDRFAGSHLATRFAHLYYVPLIPLSSWLVLEEQTDGQFVGVQVPLQLRSVLAAWLRVGSIVAAIAATAAYFSHDAHSGAGSGMLALGGLIASAVVGALAWQHLGKLSLPEKAARVAYAEFAGRYVDVGLLREGHDAIEQTTATELDRHLVRHATSGYRSAPQSDWLAIATRPDMRDVAVLKPALTRCRIAWSKAAGTERRTLELAHERILQNLMAASADLRDPKSYATYERAAL